MLRFSDFHCVNLEQNFYQHNWTCHKRHSLFMDIDAHCGDCETYKTFLKMMSEELSRRMKEGD